MTWRVDDVVWRSCGEYAWQAYFVLDDRRERQGFIIQQVSVRADILNCDKTRYFRTIKCEDRAKKATQDNARKEGPVETLVFWEIFKIIITQFGNPVFAGTGEKDGKTGYDIFGSPPTLSQSRGYAIQWGTVYFDPGKMENGQLVPSDGWEFWKRSRVPDALGLLTSCKKPSGLHFTGLSRLIATNWICCKDCPPKIDKGIAVKTPTPDLMGNVPAWIERKPK
jgi:hypothetical protein